MKAHGRHRCQGCDAWGDCYWSTDPIRLLCHACHTDLVGTTPVEPPAYLARGTL